MRGYRDWAVVSSRCSFLEHRCVFMSDGVAPLSNESFQSRYNVPQ